jgi:hypothetical protein
MAGEFIGNGPDAVVRRRVRIANRTGSARPRLGEANRIGGVRGGQAKRVSAGRARFDRPPYSGR